ncbi:uncharacterized protein NPIL_50551 [Nephila pilipes]|uniref:Protein kinase domain-containing protein n=1 Tax=Nephila pilipes TaxID=299642 RepID=A0A8X6QXZ7_NEPPI|nr:uncharacterized protein NPIL_50551 [Nephila pilipes]
MYFVTELCEYSLPHYLKKANALNPHSKVPVSFFRKLLVIELLDGIRYLHQMRFIHGHLKPSNVLVTIDHRVKLTDYYLLDIVPLTSGIQILKSNMLLVGASISNFCWRPTELISAENEKDARSNISAASDIQIFSPSYRGDFFNINYKSGSLQIDKGGIKKSTRFHRDLNSDHWIQSPAC